MERWNLIDVTEASRICGLDKGTLYRLARKGRVRSFKVLSALRFERTDVEALVAPRPTAATI